MGLFDSKTVAEMKPAKMTGDQKRLWDDYISSVYGDFDPGYYLSKNTDKVERYVNKKLGRYGENYKPLDPENLSEQEINMISRHWDRYGNDKGFEGRNPAGGTLKDTMAEDVGYVADADQKYVDTTKDTVGNYLEQMRRFTGDQNTANTQYGDTSGQNTESYIQQLLKNNTQWNDTAGGLMDNLRPTALADPVNFQFGNFSTPVITKSQQYAQGEYRGLNDDRLENNNQFGESVFDANQSQAGLLNQIANANATNSSNLSGTEMGNLNMLAQLENDNARMHTPNEAFNAYMNWLGGVNSEQNALRYSIPTTESSYTPSGMDTLIGVANAGAKIAAAM